MKRTTKNHRAPTDDAYYVSAADVADKIIDRMRRGLDPHLFAGFSSALLLADPMSKTRMAEEFD
jgi:hypothetical protein